MAGAVHNPCNHKNSRACPRSSGQIKEYINKGLAEFSSVVEIIQDLKLVENTEQQYQCLIKDFIAFRHLTAHNRVHDLGYLQMKGAFLAFCRAKVRPNDSSSRAITSVLGNIKFPRMVDLNVVVNVDWYLNIRNLPAVQNRGRGTPVTPSTMVNNLNRYVKNSFSFSDYKFAYSNGVIEVDHKGNKKQFDGELLKELAEVLKTPVKYDDGEISAFITLYHEAANIDEAGSTHTELQDVLRNLEIGCTCPMDGLLDDVADVMQHLTFK